MAIETIRYDILETLHKQHRLKGGGRSKEVCNRGVACSLLKLGSLEKNRYSFSVPLWFALRHHLFVEKTMSYVILGNDRICPFFDKKKDQKILWCQTRRI